jgi:NAD(P)-dependent dehydrogenase (short-subunit alcohol dehydrogenase family)
MDSLFGLAGRTVLVTGGGSGIGRATALLAARAGADIGVADMNAKAAEAVAVEVRSLGRKALALDFNVTDGAATSAAFERCEAVLGPLYGLITAAGTTRSDRAETMSEEAWNLVIDVNLTGTFLSCQAAARRMIAHGAGSIVTIGSTSSLGGQAARTNYCASKFAVLGLTQTLALEWGRYGVRVNCIAPGPVDTPLLRGGVPIDQIEEVLIDRTALGRMSTADEQAQAALFLLSGAASHITGVVLPVDGGASTGFMNRWNGADMASNALLARGAYGPKAGKEKAHGQA